MILVTGAAGLVGHPVANRLAQAGMTVLASDARPPDRTLDCRFIEVPRVRGQQLKEPAQLDGWLRDGSAAYTDSLCAWS